MMVVANNTDNAIMLLYHWNGEMSEIIFNSKKTEAALSIPSACSNLENKEHLLFVHAWSVCDIVSATFGKGKTSFLKLVNQSNELNGQIEITLVHCLQFYLELCILDENIRI